MRTLYTLIFYLISPLLLLRLYWRGIKAPAYRLRWRERFAYYQKVYPAPVIWIHAVSVGEAEAAFALIKLLQSRYPEEDFLVTTTTPTGSARVQSVMGDKVVHVYLPYDLPIVIQRFLAHFQPRLAVIMEKEIWPNLFAACTAKKIPVFVINARLSARSAMAYLRIPSLIKPALANINLIATQTADDKQHFLAIGANEKQVRVLGNIKFDLSIDESIHIAGRQLKLQQFSGRFVLLLASSHPGEEAAFLAIYPRLKQQIPELLLMIAPRHPERFTAVSKLAEASQLETVRRSANPLVCPACDIYIADSIGELKMLYACADLAFVGGSLVTVGGHNVLEPAAIGTPVLFGPQMFNFQDIAERMLNLNAARQCPDIESVEKNILLLYQDEGLRLDIVANARAFVAQNQGATNRIADLLATYL